MVMRLNIHKEHIVDCVGFFTVFTMTFLYIHMLGAGFIRTSLDAEMFAAIYIVINFVTFSILIVVNFENYSEKTIKGYIILLTCICVYLACNLAVFKWSSLFLSETLAPVYANILFFASLMIVILFIVLLDWSRIGDGYGKQS
jgi:hypothetical protein